jgi:hypothetical protein
MAPIKAALAPQAAAIAPATQSTALVQQTSRPLEPAAGSDERQPVASIESK